MIRALFRILAWALHLAMSFVRPVFSVVVHAHATVLTNLTHTHAEIHHLLVERQTRRQ